MYCYFSVRFNDIAENIKKGRHSTYNATFRRVCESLLPWKSNKSTYLSVYACACVRVALLIQNATRMRHFVRTCVAPNAAPYFSKLSHERHDFRRKRYFT